MKRIFLCLITLPALILSAAAVSLSQTQTDFPRGVFLFHNRFVSPSQIRDNLNATWIMTGVKTREEPTTLHTTLIDNATNAGLKAIAMNTPWIQDKAIGQHVEYEAEQEIHTTFNHFKNRLTGATVANYRKAEVGTHSEGYIVQTPFPNLELNYDNKTSIFYVTFVMKVEGSHNPSDLVARIEVYCPETDAHQPPANPMLYSEEKTFADFTPGQWQNVTIEFNRLIAVPVPPNNERLLRGDEPLPVPLGTHTCKEIDIRLYWHGSITTYLDKVIVEDIVGQQLFSGIDDQQIRDEADALDNTNYTVQRLYLNDEPIVATFASNKYVKDLVEDATQLTTTTALAYEYSRYIAYAQPNELMVDVYPIRSDIPSPVYKNDDAGADGVGVARYGSDDYYTSMLQGRLNSKLIDDNGKFGFKPVAEAAATAGLKFWFIPQLHGEYQFENGKFKYMPDFIYNPDGAGCRPPTGNEIKVMVNLALAYGAKGIVAYPYGTDVSQDFGGSAWGIFPGLVKWEAWGTNQTDHSSNYATLPPTALNVWLNTTYQVSYQQKSVWVGYAEKWDALKSVYDNLEQLESTLLGLTWQGTKSWHNSTTAGNGSAYVTACVTNVQGETKYVETGEFTLAGDTYLFVVNRRTLSNETRNITLILNNSERKKVTEVLSGQYWVIDSHSGFTATLAPGEGGLYRVSLAPPLAPTLSSPANGATGVSISPTLVWNTSAGASTYTLQVATTDNFSSPVVNQPNIAGTSTSVGLDYNTTYYWHVKAVNAGGESGWSSTWSFTTEPRYFTLTINSPCGLPTDPSPGQHSFAEGTMVNVCVTSTVVSGGTGTQYAFTNWSGDAGSSNTCVTVTMDSDKEVTANCNPQYYLTVDDNFGLGTSGEGWYDAGGTATACVNGTIITYGSTRFLLAYWYIDASGSNQCVNITMNSPKTARAFFRIQYWLEMSMSGPCGSISPSSGWYYADDAVQINAYTSGNCVFLGWSGSGSGSTSSSYPTAYVEMAEPISQHATFDYACIERSAPAWAYAFNEFEYVLPVYWPAPSGSCPLRFNIYRAPSGGGWELIAQDYGGLEFYDYPTPYTYGYNEYSYLIVTVSSTGQEIGGASATGGMYWW